MTDLINLDALSIPPEDREWIIQKTCELRLLKRSGAQVAVDTGRIFLEAKARLAHGSYLNWIKAEGFSQSTADRYVKIAERFGDGQLPIMGNIEIPSTTLALLAENATPESARQEVIERIQAGETFTGKDAKGIIERHKKEAEEYRRKLRDAEGKIKELEARPPEIREVEKQLTIEVIPEDYPELKGRVSELESALEIARGEMNRAMKESTAGSRELEDARKKLTETEHQLQEAHVRLAEADRENAVMIAQGLLIDAAASIQRAWITLENSPTKKRITPAMKKAVKEIHKRLEPFEKGE